MGLFKRVGRTVERFKQSATEATGEEAGDRCRACDERLHSADDRCPKCGADAGVSTAE